MKPHNKDSPNHGCCGTRFNQEPLICCKCEPHEGCSVGVFKKLNQTNGKEY